MEKLTRAERKERKKADRVRSDAVGIFAEAMLRRLKRQNEKDQQGALLGQKKDHDIWFYFKRINGELGELRGALKRYDINPNSVTRDAVLSECCDIANFAAAVAEKVAEGIS